MVQDIKDIFLYRDNRTRIKSTVVDKNNNVNYRRDVEEQPDNEKMGLGTDINSKKGRIELSLGDDHRINRIYSLKTILKEVRKDKTV